MRQRVFEYRRLVIDITDWNRFIFSGRPISGIQRVTLNLIRSLIQLSLPHTVIRYDILAGCHRVVDPSFFEQDFSVPRPESERGHIMPRDRYRNNPAGVMLGKWRFWLQRNRYRWKANPADRFREPYRPANGDVVFLPGAGWESSATFDAMARWRREHKIRFVVEIYDFIPFHENLYNDRIGRRQFRRWLRHAGGLADAFVLLSRFTQEDFERFRGQMGISSATETVVITPPHEFENGDEALPVTVADNLSRRRYALCVSNIFTHKNGRRAIEAWRTLNLMTRLDMTLVVAGATPAAQIERVFGRMDNVVVVEGPSDLMLINLYRHAEFTIFPSLIEGWGMPVGESLWFGRPCLASDQTAVPEVGGRQCTYFDPRIPGALERLVLERATDPALVAAEASRIDRTELKSLNGYAEEMFEYLMGATASVSPLND